MAERNGTATVPGVRERLAAKRLIEQDVAATLAFRERRRAEALAGAERFDRRAAWRAARACAAPALTLHAANGQATLNAAATDLMGEASRVDVWRYADGRLAVEAVAEGAYPLKATKTGQARFNAADLVRAVMGVPVSKRPDRPHGAGSLRLVGAAVDGVPGLLVFAPAETEG